MQCEKWMKNCGIQQKKLIKNIPKSHIDNNTEEVMKALKRTAEGKTTPFIGKNKDSSKKKD